MRKIVALKIRHRVIAIAKEKKLSFSKKVYRVVKKAYNRMPRTLRDQI